MDTHVNVPLSEQDQTVRQQSTRVGAIHATIMAHVLQKGLPSNAHVLPVSLVCEVFGRVLLIIQ